MKTRKIQKTTQFVQKVKQIFGIKLSLTLQYSSTVTLPDLDLVFLYFNELDIL